MISVKLNDQDFSADYSNITSMPDLIEFIKASIDPDLIITGLDLDGHALGEVDWRVPLSVHGDVILDVQTGSKSDYLCSRLTSSIEVVDRIVEEFSIARKHFQGGEVTDGNTAIGQAVTDLEAFFPWYNTLLEMLPSSSEQACNNYSSKIEDITSTCEQLLQQQLYQSWWALGETMEQQLEPKLSELSTCCRNIAESCE